MAIIVGIRFKDAGKIYSFDPAGLELNAGDWAVVDTAQGRECGEVMFAPKEVADTQIIAPLKRVVRRATADDMRIVQERAGKEKHAMDVCQEKVNAHKLDMKLVNVEIAFDGSKIIFYFTADGRVDFRALVRDLASVFRTRIELRQIGVRDEVKMLGGLGPCGREACCKAFLSDFSPVSIRMAKDQNLSLNPTKISGLCGRLMCCLNYEQENYATTLQRCPRKGSTVLTPEGPATVDDVLILKEKAKVRLHGEEIEIREYAFEEISEAGPKDIAEWEASGGRVRAATAKAAYKQALNKPKPKPGDEFADNADPDGFSGPVRLVKPDEPDLAMPDDAAPSIVEEGPMPQRIPVLPQQRPAPRPQQPRPQQAPQQQKPASNLAVPTENDEDEEEDAPETDSATPNGDPAKNTPNPNRRRRRGGRRRSGWHGGPRPPAKS
jgi:cell fate regulator YaaT (PSP1 superfamily)